jgi:quercetin dioxygenase-like cupin family protein
MPTHLLRLVRERLEPKAAAAPLDARPRVVYARDGQVTVRSAGQVVTLAANSAWHGSAACTLAGGSAGGEAWCWELVPAGSADRAGTLLASPVTLDDPGGYLMRCDRVDFPLGGVAYTHTHRGPGIRCLLAGEIRVEVAGGAHTVKPGEPWFEAGPDPVLALASERELTSFARVMVLPRELVGKSSIEYVLPEDQDKPKRQTYQLFVDEPISI